jgi:hypothetical protein
LSLPQADLEILDPENCKKKEHMRQQMRDMEEDGETTILVDEKRRSFFSWSCCETTYKIWSEAFNSSSVV